ncbi:MAG: MBL fold metallo-hydrolase [Acidobacteria bacterium]|nr:MBL fold metallo-hydrolase [Acidobacteriota bacterium]
MSDPAKVFPEIFPRQAGGAISIRMAVLGSGSSGNCTFLATERVKVLIDAGLSGRDTLRRLASIGEKPESLQAILVTHEHSDHISGLARLASHYKIPVYVSSPTQAVLPPRVKLPAVETIQAGKQFEIGDLTIDPFTIPHDAVDPVAFRLTAGGIRVAVVTDLGYIPENVKYYLRGCHCLVLEANHDLEMLRNGPYPWFVKQRVMSRDGHLSNHALSNFLSNDFDGTAQVLVLAHLSECNNHPEIARMAATSALEAQNGRETRLAVSSQQQPTEMFRF